MDLVQGERIRDERVRSVGFVRQALRRPELGAAAGCILVLLFFAIVAGDSGLFSGRGIVNFVEVSAQLGILAVAVALLMIGGEFDLSLGSMVAFSGVLIAILATQYHIAIWICIPIAFAAAILVGYINGMLVVKTGLPSFIVTLASLFILRGVTLGTTRAMTGRTQIPGMKELTEGDPLAPLFNGLMGRDLFVKLADWGWVATRPDGLPEVQGIPVSILWWIGLTALATWVLLNTRFGNWIFTVGGDANAARNVGVPVAKVKVRLFILTACAATLFAVIQVLSVGSADTARGLQKEFEAIIAVVIGGALLTGGYGSAVGAMFGALIFGIVRQGIIYTGIDTDWFNVFMGLMLLAAVLFNNYIRKKAAEAR